MPDSPSPSTPPWAQSEADVAELVEQFAEGHSAVPWRIVSDGEAEWAMAHLGAAQATLAAIRDQYELWLNQLAEWMVAASKEPKRTVEFFDAHLRQYALARRQADPRVKTLALPSGRVPTQERSPQVVIVDDAAVIAWAENTLLPGLTVGQIVGGRGEPTTVAEAGVVKVTKEAMVSALRKLTVVHEVECDGCGGDGSIDSTLNDDDARLVSDNIETCPDCDGRGKVFHVLLAGDTGELVPGVAVDPGGIAVSAPAPVRPVKL